MHTINREQLAWAAGIYEGEGTFSSRKTGKIDRGLVAKLKMADEDVIRRFHAILGVGNVTGPYKCDGAGTKPLWVWQCGSFQAVQHTMAVLWPWLCSRRRAKIQTLLLLHRHSATLLKRIYINGKYYKNPQYGSA